jgi:phosphohistidine phosphatase SixA
MKLCTALFTLAASAGFLAWPVPSARAGAFEHEPVTIFFVRHAETAGSTRTGGDPGLSQAGRERAEALARLLSHAGVGQLFSSEFARTRATLAPLAQLLEKQLRIVPAREREEQLEELRRLEPGTVAVVAGHSNTVPGLVFGLGGKIEGLVREDSREALLDHDQYDRVFVVTLDARTRLAQTTLELRYGPALPSPGGR